MNPATLAHLTRAATTDAHLVSIAPADLRELLGWYRSGYADALKAVEKYHTSLAEMYSASLAKYGHDYSRDEVRENTHLRAAKAIAAIPVPEAPKT
jgi:hypothetical protein